MLFLKGFLFPVFLVIFIIMAVVFLAIPILILCGLYVIFEILSEYGHEIFAAFFCFLCFCVICGLLSWGSVKDSALNKAFYFVISPAGHYVEFLETEYPFFEDVENFLSLSDNG